MDKHQLLIRFDELRQHRCLQTGYFILSATVLLLAIGGQFYLIAAGIKSLTLYTVLPMIQLASLCASTHFLLRCLYSWVGLRAFCAQHQHIKEHWEATRSRRPNFFEQLF